MSAIDGPGKLNESSTYVMGFAMGYVVPKHHSIASTCTEYTMQEALKINMTGIGSEVEHGGEGTNVGTVVGYRPVPSLNKVEVLIELPASSCLYATHVKNQILGQLLTELSLQHAFSPDENGGIEKTEIEVSFCQAGAREGSFVTEVFPSNMLLNCQTHGILRLFAARYGYPLPPDLPNMDAGQMQMAGVLESRELDDYVNKTLWPRVAMRRQALLKLNGYISASKTQITKTNMATPNNTPAAVARQIETAIAAQTIPVEMTPVPVVAAEQPATSPSMAVDPAAPSKIGTNDMMLQIQKLVDEQRNQLAETNAKLKEYQTNNAALAKQNHQILLKSKVDGFLGRCDAFWSPEERAAKKAEMDRAFETAQDISDDKVAEKFVEKAWNGIVAAAKVDQERKKVQTVQQQQQQKEDEQRELQGLTKLWSSVMSSKSGVDLSQSAIIPTQVKASLKPQAAFDQTLDDDDDDEPIEQTTKKHGVTVIEAGKVAAAKQPQSAASTQVPTTLREAHVLSHQIQEGNTLITAPSLSDLKKGGFVAGVVRRAAGPNGGVKFMHAQTRFENEIPGQVGMAQWNPARNTDMLQSVSRGKIYFDGQVQASLGMSQSTYDELVANSVQGEMFCSKYAQPL